MRSLHCMKSEIYPTKYPWVCPKYELNISVYLDTSKIFLKYNWLYIYVHLRKQTISCKQEYLVNTLGGICHITCVYADILMYTNNILIDTQVYTRYMPSASCLYLWICQLNDPCFREAWSSMPVKWHMFQGNHGAACQLHDTCFREAWSSMPVTWHMFQGSMEQHVIYMTHVSGEARGAYQLHDMCFWNHGNVGQLYVTCLRGSIKG